MASVKGQALTELAVSISVPVLLLIWGAPLIWSVLNERMQAQQLINTDIELAEYRSSESGRLFDSRTLSDKANWPEPDSSHFIGRSSNYSFAQVLRPIIQSVNTIGNAGFETNNLITVRRKREGATWLLQAKLVDDWSPHNQAQLTTRPAALTATYQLQRAGFGHMQSFVGLLPFAREFRSDSFKPGHVDIDVFPDGAP